MRDGFIVNGPDAGSYFESDCDYFNRMPPSDHRAMGVDDAAIKDDAFTPITYLKKWRARDLHRWYVWEC